MDPLVTVKGLSAERINQHLGLWSMTPATATGSFTTRLFTHFAAISLLLLLWAGSTHAQLPFGPDLAALQKKQESGLRITGFGRFQVFVSPSIKGETFMIDSDTGKVWVFKKDHATGKYSLERLSVEQVDPDAKKDADKDK